MVKKYLAIIILLLFGCANTALGAVWSYEQDFEGLSTGDLNTQDSWTGSTNWDVSDSAPIEGLQSAKIVNPAGQSQINRNVGDSTGIFQFSIKKTVNNIRTTIRLFAGGYDTNEKISLYFEDDGYITVERGGGSPVDLQAYSANTLYVVYIELESSSGKFKIKIDEGEWFGEYSYSSALGGECDDIMFREETGTHTVWFDDIKPFAEESPSPTPTGGATTTATVLDDYLGGYQTALVWCFGAIVFIAFIKGILIVISGFRVWIKKNI